MSTKLFIYKLKLPYSEESSVLFSALAEDELSAKSLILKKVVNEVYKNDLKTLFEDKNTRPIIYENGDVFIQLLGDIKLFTQ